ncbi:MAG: GNAT family N-acetyltransferase [Candidatus Zipacnadales bacterium]
MALGIMGRSTTGHHQVRKFALPRGDPSPRGELGNLGCTVFRQIRCSLDSDPPNEAHNQMEGLVCREATPADVHDILAVRNAIFPPLTPEQWFADPTMTCSLAYLNGEPVSAIPLSLRPFQIAPGVCIRTAFENAVGTREDMRSKGIGTAVTRAAKEFLADRCDELMVYRGAERSAGYRFYVKSGHCDLLYLRPMTLTQPQRREVEASVQGLQEICACQAELLACFEATYGEFGGFPPRHANYWKQQLNSQIYDVLPQDTFFFRYPPSGPLQAYVLVGRSLRDDRRDYLRIMEVAGKTPANTEQVLLALEDFAAQEHLSVHAYTSAEDPLRPLMRRLGYTEGLRTTMIMGQPISPANLFVRTCADTSVLESLKIDFWAPFGEGTLFEGPSAMQEVTLEGKDEVIYRLLNRRLDVRAAFATEWLTVRNASSDIIERLAAAFPYSRWVYHHIDYI